MADIWLLFTNASIMVIVLFMLGSIFMASHLTDRRLPWLASSTYALKFLRTGS